MDWCGVGKNLVVRVWVAPSANVSFVFTPGCTTLTRSLKTDVRFAVGATQRLTDLTNFKNLSNLHAIEKKAWP
jgi:hypothetical protein